MARFNLKSLQTRTASAALLIPTVLGLVFLGGWPFIALLAVLSGISLYEWTGLALKCTERERLLLGGLGVFYIIGSFACCYFVFEILGFYWAFMFLFMIWGSDIGAYFTGKFIGGPKMAEGISPNKTWAGFLGAALSPALIGFVAVFLFKGVDGFSFYSAFAVAGFGILIGISGQAGDLVISAFKRRAGVKDTGNLIPGHGGLLDRIDSMLLAAPVFLLLMTIVHHGL